MNARGLLLLAALAAPAQALELDQPEIRFAPDCSVLLTLRLVTEPEVDPEWTWVEIASPPTYRKFEAAYPPWVASAQLEWSRETQENRIQVRSTEPLPIHSSVLMLAFTTGHELPVFHTLDMPPCEVSGPLLEVEWGDTLFEIALEHAHDLEVDAHTLMLAIQLYNRDAFIHDNINLMRAGARLYLPSQAEIAHLNLPRQWLIDEVRFQNEQWRKWHQNRTDPRESPTLQQRRLQLVPLKVQASPAEPEPDADPAPEPSEPAPADAEPAKPEPDAATAPDTVKIESDRLAPLADDDARKAQAEWIDNLPGLQVLVATGILILLYLISLGLRRWRHARIIRQSVGEIKDPARRATSALDLAHAHVETQEYDKALPLIRLVQADGTEQEREEANRLQDRMGPT